MNQWLTGLGRWVSYRERLALVIFIGLVLSIHYSVTEFESPKKDALRYVDYAYTLSSHGTFGLSCNRSGSQPCPGNANSPLYPAILALVSLADHQLQGDFGCLVKANGVRPDCIIGLDKKVDEVDSTAGQCKYHYSSIIILQYLFAGCSLLVIWLLANHILASRSQAWLALVAALLSGILTKYAGRLLTENLLILLFLLFQYNLICLWRRQTFFLFGVFGVLLALMTLTRPEYLYLAVILFAAVFMIAAITKNKRIATQGIAASLIFICLLAPWAVRNHHHFGSPALTGGNYGEIILSHRAAYNQMGVRQWLGSFIYWLPDFGDSMAKRVLPEAWYWQHIDERDGSFQDIAETKISYVLGADDGGSKGVGYLLRTEVLDHPLKHGLVSIPLIWRGAFIAKYWGIIGAFAYFLLLARCIKNRHWLLAVVSLPAWFLVVFHAAISVNVPRYNLMLVGVYSLAWAWMLQHLYFRLTGRSNPKLQLSS